MEFDRFSTLVDIYRGLLPTFQTYVKLLQKEEPTLHVIVAKMFLLVREVLVLFLKRSCIPEAGSKKKTLSLKKKGVLSSSDTQLSDASLGVGEFAFSSYSAGLQKKSRWAKDVASKLREGYRLCTEHLLEKLPLRYPTLVHLAALQPEAWDDDGFRPSILSLARQLPQVVKEEDIGKLDTQARSFSVDDDVRSFVVEFDPAHHRIDRDFWSKVFRLQAEGKQRYPHLAALVKALLSICTGPIVELVI